MLAACSAGCGGARQGAGGASRNATAARASNGSLSVVQAAARATLALPAGVEFELHGARTFGASHAPVLGSGEFDFPSGTGSEKIDLGEVGHQEPGNEQVIFLPSRVYLQPKAPSTTVLPKGKEWVSATLAGSDTVSTNFPSFALQAEGVNPQLLLSEISGGAVSASPAGDTSIAGVPAHAYDVDVDLPRALAASAGPSATVFGAAIQSELAALAGGASSGGQRTSIRVWLDGAGHVIRLQGSPPGAGLGVASMTLCCFGLPVAVAAPPARRVVDITALTPSGERENNGGGDSDGG
jgi:hypothetical protein